MVERTGRDIAVVGIGAVFPGAPNAQVFWRNIMAGCPSPRSADSVVLVGGADARHTGSVDHASKNGNAAPQSAVQRPWPSPAQAGDGRPPPQAPRQRNYQRAVQTENHRDCLDSGHQVLRSGQ
ncbi:beta-ketoacyl synthase N-terminal-like domain-containing protein [Nocardia sp. NPDC055029]